MPHGVVVFAKLGDDCVAAFAYLEAKVVHAVAVPVQEFPEGAGLLIRLVQLYYKFAGLYYGNLKPVFRRLAPVSYIRVGVREWGRASILFAYEIYNENRL